MTEILIKVFVTVTVNLIYIKLSRSVLFINERYRGKDSGFPT